MENVTDTPPPETEPVQSDAPPATYTCEGCSEEIAEDDSCDTCYYCSACDENHDPDNHPACSSCRARYEREERAYRQNYRYNPPGELRSMCCEDSCDSRGDCFYCEGCCDRHDTYHATLCSNCNSCTDYHNCAYCESCSEYCDPEDMCGNDGCDSCENHCDCGPESDEDDGTGYGGSNPRWLSNPTTFYYGKPTATMPSRRTVAAEIEVAGGGRGVYAPLDSWRGKIVPDGSVTGGYEINTSPATGDKWEAQITEICEALNDDNARVNTNCGLHIHVGAHDFSYMDHIRLLWIWEHIENAVFSCLPNSRQSNTYCAKRAHKIRETLGAPREMRGKEVRRALVAAIRDGGEIPYTYQFATDSEYRKARAAYDKATASGKPWLSRVTLESFVPVAVRGKKAVTPKSPGGTRYYAINLQALFEHGTIEFRCHSGTTDAEKIRNWGQLCAAMLDFAKRANIQRIREFREMNGFDAMLSLVATDDQRQYWRERRQRFAR